MIRHFSQISELRTKTRWATLCLGLLFLGSFSQASQTLLTVTNYDSARQRATIQVSNDQTVVRGTKIRINTNSGSCIVEVTDQANDLLVTKAPNCSESVLRKGLQVAYGVPITTNTASAPQEAEDVSKRRPAWENDSPAQNWPSEGKFTSGRVATAAGWGMLAPLKDRISVYLGHNFSNDLEGKVTPSGEVKDLGGQTAFTLGVFGRVYNFSPKVGLSVGIGHDFMRTFDQATLISNNSEVRAPNPAGDTRISLWSLYTQAEVEVYDKIMVFGGINISIPRENDTPLKFSSDLGFQVGAAYEVFSQFMVEGLIKISNLNVENTSLPENPAIEKTDVSLAGIELRGRYTF